MCFSIILVCPYLTFDFWTNILKEKTITCFFGLSIGWNPCFKNKELELKKMFFNRLCVSIPHFWFLIKYVCENKNIFCILVGVIITFFIVLVTGVQSRKIVFFYHLGVSLPYFWFLNEYAQENKCQLHVIFGLSIRWNSFFNKMNLTWKKVFFDHVGVSIPHF